MTSMSTSHLSRTAWAEAFQGYEIVAVAIRDRNTLQALSRKAIPHEQATHLLDGEIPTRVVSIFLDDVSDKNAGYREITGMTHPRLGVSRAPFHHGVLVASMDRDGDTYPVGGGLDGPFEKIDAGRWPGLQRLKCIAYQTYAVALARRLYRRTAVGKWEQISGIPMSTNEAALKAAGFEDLDAFSESDMYAVGGHGDLWHFDGRAWHQLRIWNGREITTPEHDGKTILASGHMDAHDGLLVVADLWTVSTFDGQAWRKVVAPYKD